MKSNKLYILLSFLVSISSFSQVDWPIEDGDLQARVIGKVGEVRYSVRLHKGVDINKDIGGGNCENGDCDIYAINSGFVTWNNAGNWNHANSYIQIGGVKYRHCRPTDAILNSGGGMTEVEIGDKIGSMITTGPVHVHLEESNTNYLNGNLSPYVDTENPTLTQNAARFPEGYQLYRNGINRLSTLAQLETNELDIVVTHDNVNYKIIHSKVDIAVEIEDRGVLSPSGGVTAGNSTPFGYEYQLQDYDNPNIIEPLYEYLLEFDRAPATAANDFVLHRYAFGTGVIDSHIITSHPRDEPYPRYFNTAIQENTEETWDNTNNLNAEYNGNAEFPDDKYRLYIDAYDVDFADNSNNRLENRIDVPVIIDNFLPYIKKVEAYNILTGSLIYRGQWSYQNDLLSFTIDVNTQISGNTPVYVKAYASEPLTELKLTLGGNEYNFAEITETSFIVDVNTPDFFFGLNTLRLEGKDLANNDLLTNPSLLPIKMANGNWPGGTSTGYDTWHKINVSDGNSTSFGADFINGGSCGANRLTNENCLEVCFEDTSTPVGSITDWFWEFGDFNSTTSTIQNPAFTYDSPGTYDVTLTVTNTNNETSNITKTITVDDCDANIQALITADATSGVAPFVVTFSDLSTGEIESRQWNISNENGVQYVSGNEFSTNIQLSFAYEGTYQISLELEDEFGSVVTSNILVINVSSQSNTPLYVDFHTEGPVYTGSIIQFESETSQGCSNLQYSWTFYDYNGPHYSTYPDPTYSFPVPGNYTVELCVNDDCGNHVCVSKNINISNYTSNVFASMWANIGFQDWIVEKGEPITFYDNSQPEGDILYGSWFFDYHEGVNGPDLFYYYPEPPSGIITHTYNEVGTYRVRLYVGENANYFGSYDERIITVVDDYDYLDIPTLHESNRQVFTDKYMQNVQIKNFNGYLLATTRDYTNSSYTYSYDCITSVEVYEENSSHDYVNPVTILSIPEKPFIYAKGFNDMIAIGIREFASYIYTIYIYKKNGNDWSSFELIQMLNYNLPTNYDSLKLDLFGNTLIVGVHELSGVKNIYVYDFNQTTSLFEHSAVLLNSSAQFNSFGQWGSFGDYISLNDDTIISSSGNFANQRINVYGKTDIGWVNSIENAKLGANTNYADYPNDFNINFHNSIVDNTILAPYSQGGLFVYEKPDNGNWGNSNENARLFNYRGNIEDDWYPYNFGTNLPHYPAVLSDNTNYVVARGHPIRDFQHPENPGLWNCLYLFYKNGNSWEDKTVEDFRLYPLGVTQNEYRNYILDEYNNKLIHLYRTFHNYENNTGHNNTVLYTYDLTGNSGNGGQSGAGVCYQDVVIENQTISNSTQPGVEGATITLKNMTINNGAGVIYQAVQNIIIEPNTHIKPGAYFNAKIVDCNLIDQ